MIRRILTCTSLLALVASSCSFAFSTTDLLFYANQSNAVVKTDGTMTWGSGITFNSIAATSGNSSTVKNPSVVSLTNATTGIAANWVKTVPGDLVAGTTTPVTYTTPGTKAGSGFSSAIVNSDTKSLSNTGFTIVAAINPELQPLACNDIRRIVDIFGGALMLGMKDGGELYARFLNYNGTTWTNNSLTSTKKVSSGPIVVSLTITTGGVYNVWAGDTLFLSGTSTNWTGASLPWNNYTTTPPALSSKNSIGIGSVGGPASSVAATTFRGYIGDTYVYTTALSDIDRLNLVSEVQTSMGMTAPASVPEPGSVIALLSGLVGLAGFARRRK